MKKSVLLLFVSGMIFLFVSGSMLVQAQIKPDVPEFTLELVDVSFYLFPGPAQNMDPDTGTYTNEGKTQTYQALYIDSWRIDVIIKNQYDTTRYNIRIKADFEQEWTEHLYRHSSSSFPNRPESEKEYTVRGYDVNSYPDDTRVEVQVEALSGTILRTAEGGDSGVPIDRYNSFYEAGRSGWSESQIITIDRKGENLSDQSLKDSSFNWIELSLFVSAIIILIVVVTSCLYLKRHKQKMFTTPTSYDTPNI